MVQLAMVNTCTSPVNMSFILCTLLQPERINPESGQKGYDIRSDVWSLGITMVTIYYLIIKLNTCNKQRTHL